MWCASGRGDLPAATLCLGLLLGAIASAVADPPQAARPVARPAARPVAPGVPLLESFAIARENSEAVVTFDLEGEGFSWAEAGRESVVLRAHVDGRPCHDVLAFGGTQEHRFVVGPLPAGRHELRLEFDAARSPAQDGRVFVRGIRVEDAGDAAWLRHAPIVYGRTGGRGGTPLATYSDAPLLVYVIQEGSGAGVEYEYALVSSNEDGGTGLFPPAMMGKFGRTTDIEWVYRVRLDGAGEVAGEWFQGVGHERRRFQGRKEGRHPLLEVASDNINFREAAEELDATRALRSALAPVRLEGDGPRERVQDPRPWIHRVQDQELSRERSLFGPKREPSPRADTAHVSDLRGYLLLDLDLESPGGTSWRFSARIGDRWYASDHGIVLCGYAGSGWGRTSIELPAGAGAEAITALRAEVLGLPEGAHARVRTLRAFGLAEDYAVRPAVLDVHSERRLTRAEPRQEWRRDAD